MSKYYYKRDKLKIRKALQVFSSLVFLAGFILIIYVFFPLLSWQIYFAPVFASQNIEVPIPKTTIVSGATITDLISSATNSLGKDFTNSSNWYPSDLRPGDKSLKDYTISIPKIDIQDAKVSSHDNDLTKHLVQYNQDLEPPSKGNTVIFGHSTLPQLFEKGNYKTIFANAYKLQVNDEILIDMGSIKYQYKIEKITVIEPTDTSVLAQDFSDSFITIITCTPPGTIWKRLVIKARIENL